MKNLYLLLGLMAAGSLAKAQTCSTTITTYPYVQDFENGAAGWTAGGANSSWALGTPAKSVINSAASGTKAWVTNLTGIYNASEASDVTSPCFNTTTLVAPIIEMKVWWNSEGGWDGAVLQSSIDNGATWQNVGNFGDPNNWYNDNSLDQRAGGQDIGWAGTGTSSSNGWVTAKHALTGLGGKTSVKFRIAFGSDASVHYDGFAFDNVSIYESPANDLELLAISAPAGSSCAFTTTETVTISIKNLGSTAATNFPVSYQIGTTGTPVQETVMQTILPGATGTYSFTNKLNLAAPGTYNVIAKTLLANDGNPNNNSRSSNVISVPSVSTLPYTEGFENGNGGWTVGGSSPSWAIGTPAKAVINSAGTGLNSWVTGLTGTYNGSENSYVLSPCFSFASVPDPDFEMKAWWNSETGWDGAVLQSSIDGGLTWQNVGNLGDPFNWYNDNSLDGRAGGQDIGWAGTGTSSSNGWVRVKHKLNGLGGKNSVRLRIAFGADGSVNYDGFAFDDIRIGDNTNNLSVNAITPLTKLCGFAANEPITAVIENLGSVPVSGYTVSYTVNGVQVGSQTISTPLASNAPTNFTFTTPANLAAAGSYTIVVTVTKTGDPEPGNNSLTYTVSNATFTGMPPTFNFETGGSGASQLRVVTKPKASVFENTAASSPFTTGSTKGLILDGIDQPSWMIPVGVTDPWLNNLDNFSAAYICFNPSSCTGLDSLVLTFDLKQLFKTANANTNFRVTVNGTQVGPTYRPPFAGSPIDWKHIRVDLTPYKGTSGIQIGLESSVKEAYANGAGTANLVDNIKVECRTVSGVKEMLLNGQVKVFPNPSNGLFNVSLPKGKTYTLELADLTGRTIKRITATGDTQLSTDNQAKGIYLLKITSEGSTAVQKLIVE